MSAARRERRGKGGKHPSQRSTGMDPKILPCAVVERQLVSRFRADARAPIQELHESAPCSGPDDDLWEWADMKKDRFLERARGWPGFRLLSGVLLAGALA